MFAAGFPSCFGCDSVFGRRLVRDANAPQRAVHDKLPFIVFGKQSTVHLFIHIHVDVLLHTHGHTHTHTSLLWIFMSRAHVETDTGRGGGSPFQRSRVRVIIPPFLICPSLIPHLSFLHLSSVLHPSSLHLIPPFPSCGPEQPLYCSQSPGGAVPRSASRCRRSRHATQAGLGHVTS